MNATNHLKQNQFRIYFRKSYLGLFEKYAHVLNGKIVFIFLLLLLSSCNPFPKMYRVYYYPNSSAKCKNEISVLNGNQRPEIHKSNNIDEDVKAARAQYYECIGMSSFSLGCNSLWEKTIERWQAEAVEKQAIKIGATYSLYSKRFAYTSHTNVTQTTVNSTTGVMTTAPSSPDVDMYKFDAYYFVKMEDIPIVGVEYETIDNQTRDLLKQNTGVVVTTVYANTSIFYANVVVGDVITKVNDNIVRNKYDMDNLLINLKKGDSLSIVIVRQSGEKIISIQL